jgi:serine/threonine-protein kinase PRP4
MFDDAALGQQLFSNPTDAEGYYRVVSGEILNGRFRVIEKCGKGVFGSVVKAQDTNTNKEYAIKIIRTNEIYTRSGEK